MLSRSMARLAGIRLVSSSSRAFSRFSGVEMGSLDPILEIQEAFVKDKNPNKLSFGIGAYRDDNAKPVVLPSILKAQNIVNDAGFDNEYGPIAGDPEYVRLSMELAYGPDVDYDRIFGMQSLSGTGALRLLGAFLAKHCGNPTVFVPNPTWKNHFEIFRSEGMTVEKYKYYDGKMSLDFRGMCEDLKSKPAGSVVLLHSSAHNPTGIDPTVEQWSEISSVCKDKDFMCIFDMAYQGLASGDLEKDAQPVRQFLTDGNDIAICQSFAKNFGLYSKRIGTLSIVCADKEEKTRVESQMKVAARAMYSSPPVRGAQVVKAILKDQALKQEWLDDVKMMADRIILMRTMLRDELEALGNPGPGSPPAGWQHITNQIGMFCFSGMTAENVHALARDHSIYTTTNGRISMAGVTTKNVKVLAKAMTEVMHSSTYELNL